MLLVPLACGLDRLLGDPRWLPHPVQFMGSAISWGRRMGEAWAIDRTWRLRGVGLVITLAVVGSSAGAGWCIEQFALRAPVLGGSLLVVGLASALAGRSLEQAVRGVIEVLNDLNSARSRLTWIVGRQVDGLGQAEILRAAAETAAENAVDGLFAPLFWMQLG